MLRRKIMFGRESLKKITDYLWEIPKTGQMRVAARFYASEKMMKDILQDRSLEQLVNVAVLPEIQKYALAMPDIHEGYGFPIGGVAAVSYPEGVISPGGIGYDINCGIRFLKSTLTFEETKGQCGNLSHSLFKEIPSGVGKGGKIKLGTAEMDKVLQNGAEWVLEQGYADKQDLKNIESGGRLREVDVSCVSDHAKKRGRDQLGTLGAGNHFVEVDTVEEILDKQWAEKFGLFQNQAGVLVHTGSRGLGHQVATDYIKIMVAALEKHKLNLPDRELACAPFDSEEGKNYFSAMAGAANFAWANRQMLTWHIRNVWKKIFGDEKLSLLYDVAHNIAKIEEYENKKLIVHRKGATRAFPGQPVIIPGTMGTSSYILVGAEKAMVESFGSVCHGAGRTMSRTKAGKQVNPKELKQQLEEKGIIVNPGSLRGLAEEAPLAYKDVDDVVNIVEMAGLAKKVARLKPLVVIKG